MAMVRITAAQVRQKVSELRNLDSQFKAKADSLSASEESIAAKWDGDAKAAFRNSFQKDRVNMDNFYKVIEQYCATLENIANRMEQADANSAQIAAQR